MSSKDLHDLLDGLDRKHSSAVPHAIPVDPPSVSPTSVSSASCVDSNSLVDPTPDTGPSCTDRIAPVASPVSPVAPTTVEQADMDHMLEHEFVNEFAAEMELDDEFDFDF